MNNQKIPGIQEEFKWQLNSQIVSLAFIQVPIQIQLFYFNLLIGLDENKWWIWNIVNYEIKFNEKLLRLIRNCYYPIIYEEKRMLFIINRGHNWKMISLLNYEVIEKATSKKIKNLMDNYMINYRFIHYSQVKIFYIVDLNNQKSKKMFMQQILYDSYGGKFITAIQTLEQQYLITTKFKKLIRINSNIKYYEKYQFKDQYTLLKPQGQVYNNLSLKMEYQIESGSKDAMINDCQNHKMKQNYYLIILYGNRIQIVEMKTYQCVHIFQFKFEFDYQQILYDYTNHEILILIKQEQIDSQK